MSIYPIKSIGLGALYYHKYVYTDKHTRPTRLL